MKARDPVSPPTKTAAEGLAHFVAGLSLDRVPEAVVERAKLHVLDALTTAVAAVRSPAGKIMARALDPIDAGGPARIIATGAPASVNTAATVNTQMSVALDLGTNLYYSQGLGGLAVFGALALAEAGKLPGKALLQAVIAGFEVAGRIALSFRPHWRVEGTRMIGAISSGPGTRWVALGAAAANARIRSLDAAHTAHGLALAAASVPLPARWDWGDEVPMAKYGLFGNMAASALNAALMGERGFTGDLRVLDAADGFHRLLGQDCFDPAAMTRDFGERWLISEAGFKRYPSGTHNQQAMHALDELVRKHRIDPDAIRSIRVGRAIGTTGAFANAAPGNEVAAQFSLPFMLAAIALGIPPREWHASVDDARLRSLAARVQLVEDAAAVKEFAANSADVQRSPWPLRSHVSVETAERTFEQWSEYGEVAEREIADKFRHHTEGILAERQIGKIIDAALMLERLPHVSQLTASFAGDGR